MKNINAKLKILLENLPIDCRYYKDDKWCKRYIEEYSEAYTNCDGKILDCERSWEETLKEPES